MATEHGFVDTHGDVLMLLMSEMSETIRSKHVKSNRLKAGNFSQRWLALVTVTNFCPTRPLITFEADFES